MNKKHTHILICDEDINLSMVLCDWLRSKDYIVDVVHTGQNALDSIRSAHYDICLLEISVSNKNGYEVLADLRRTENDIPVIMLTNRTAREDIIRAFDLGCDDYVTKPFSMDILLCRIKAVINRYTKNNESKQAVFNLGGKEFDSINQRINGEHMSARESDLLLMLCRNANQVVDRHVILCALWSTDDYFSSRSLSVYINHLRAYLEGTNVRIMGVHGKGYKLVID